MCALAGYTVVLNDVSSDALTRGLATIETNMTRWSAASVLALMRCAKREGHFNCHGATALSSVDLVIEAATENREVEKIFAACVRSSFACLFGHQYVLHFGNVLAATTDRPKIYRATFHESGSGDEAMEIIRGLAMMMRPIALPWNSPAASARQQPMPRTIRPLSSIASVPMINEAVYALYEGVGTVESIDTAMKLGANHLMGPLNWPISLAWIHVYQLCKCYMMDWAIPATSLSAFGKVC